MKGLIAALVILLIATTFTAIYYYQKASAAPKTIEDSQAALQVEVNTLLENVGKLIVLPPDEKPVIATVADPTKLQGQPFFANAQIGDKVIIYPEARKAILYNPESNKIVEVAPLNIGQPDEAPATAPADSEAQ